MEFKYFGCCILLIAVVMQSKFMYGTGFAVQPVSFSRSSSTISRSCQSPTTRSHQLMIISSSSSSSNDAVVEEAGPEDLVGCKITVAGDVHGGYYRACVLNEAGKFRRLSGTMSDPNDTDSAEIYVEGKLKVIEGFVRWCRQSAKKVALNQKITVTSVTYDNEPTGLYDAFYCRIK